MTYQAYQVSNFKSGLVTSREDFLIPEDAFSKLENCQLRNGVLEKRKGYQVIDIMVSTDTDTNVTSDTTDTIVGIVDHKSNGVVKTVVFNTTRANVLAGVDKTLSDLTRKVITFDHGGSQVFSPPVGSIVEGLVSGATGTVSSLFVDNGSFQTSTASGTIVFENDSINGASFLNGEEIASSLSFTDVIGVTRSTAEDNVFTGEDNDFFRGVNWEGVLYITNGKDQIRKYNGTDMTLHNLDLSTLGGPDNDMNTCRMIFLYKNRLVFLDTTESGTRHRQRVRYTESLLPNQSKSTSTIDAPTDAEIITADFIDEDLVVWFDDETWKLLYTGDTNIPFEWRRIDRERGCSAPFSLVARGIEQVCFGLKRILHTEGRFVSEADIAINRFIERVSDGFIDYSFGKYFPTLNQHWITFVDVNDTDDKPGHVLVFDWEEKDFAIHKFPIHVLGETNSTSDLYIDDLPNSVLLDDLDFSFDDVPPAGSKVLLVFGNRDGELCEFNVTNQDKGAPFTMTATWGKINPFWKDSKLCDFGYVDFYVDVNPNITFTVEFFLDNDTTSFKSSSINCTGDQLNDDKVWKRIYVNAVGEFHRMRLTDSSSQQLKVHAVVFHFREGGSISI